jgi:acetyl esterase
MEHTELPDGLQPDVARYLRNAGAASPPPDWASLSGSAAQSYLAQARQPRAGTAGPELAAVRATGTRTDDGTGVRIYSRPDEAAAPLIVYLHGGGWVMGDLELNDAMCRRLTREFGFVIVSVDYRLAPEHPFPVPLEDCYAATVWAARQAPALGADPGRLLVMGSSAGGNLAAAVTLLARDRGTPPLAGQVLLYPVLDSTMASESYRINATGYLLEREQMRWYWQQYTPDSADRATALASPLQAPDLAGLPPAVVVTTQFDPLRDEGEQYAARLREAGVRAEYRCYDGQIHGFLGQPDAISQATPATIEIGELITAILPSGTD